MHYVPWHRPPTPGQSAISWIISYQYWMFINGDSGRPNPEVSRRADPEAQIMEISSAAAEIDTSAPWSILDHLNEMGSLWKKIVLPNEWDIQNASIGNLDKQGEAGYIIETYEWAKATYDGSNWKHHMELVWAILFSTILPKVFFPDEWRGKIAAPGSNA
ncbi:hypothetical protein P691DRAFT_781619 [Macrolepiota fuliginosa MF-IS2]|uniref:Uncharacterized protein n=1 Tax=Macrolepiota fuliginosa MF-IS2 TaxID=1400762 RepID=A0A9P6BWF5_9AGAR|nr:hypothetical protein P691DRAFT_781619 [Macrolepiota fuliginosa MF-IS2]